MLHLPAGARVLEAGCATGGLAADLAAAGYDARGIDVSPTMIDRAAALHPRVPFDCGSADRLPYASGTLDAVVAASLLNVVPDAAAVAREMVRVTRRAGVASFLVPSEEFGGRARPRGRAPFARAEAGGWRPTHLAVAGTHALHPGEPACRLRGE